VCSNYKGLYNYKITLHSFLRKVFARALERRIQTIVEPHIQEEQLYTLSRVLEGSWEFAQPIHMCFVDLEKAFDYVHRGILWGVLWEYGVRGPC